MLPVLGIRFWVMLKSFAMSLEVADTNSHVMSVMKNVVFHFPFTINLHHKVGYDKCLDNIKWPCAITE